MINEDEKKEYWITCIYEAAEEAALVLTDKQASILSNYIQEAHDAHNMFFPSEYGSPTIDSHNDNEIEKLKKELKEERGKITCRDCNGSGYITIQLPSHTASSGCTHCNGTGRT